ncbi:hypothetical protein BKA66DRAFT_597235 [Pyrenochaeta sp. MPI-SDFR-AT-0127]|nr:hypothetical protein BKA66DRAFT_597235 [Pyrenochaeta sp. MPI-SDFR-AT-0127]
MCIHPTNLFSAVPSPLITVHCLSTAPSSNTNTSPARGPLKMRSQSASSRGDIARKREDEHDDVEYTIESEGARDIVAYQRGDFHIAFGKYTYTGEIAKADVTSAMAVRINCAALIYHGLPRDLLIAGQHRCTWFVPACLARLFSERINETMKNPLDCLTIKMMDHPPYAVDCAVTHIIHQAEYRVIKYLQEQKLYNAKSHGIEPVVPENITASRIHVDVFILGHYWKIYNLKILARDELVKALGLTDRISLQQFKDLVLDTGIFTEKFAKSPTCDEHLVDDVLRLLGSYAATRHEAWMAEDRIGYMDMVPKAPYFAVYRDLAQAGHQAFLRDLPPSSKRVKRNDNGMSGQRDDHKVSVICG